MQNQGGYQPMQNIDNQQMQNLGNMSMQNMGGQPLFYQQNIPQNMQMTNDLGQSQVNKKIPNPQNYKIVKCKNFEKGI